MTQGQITVSKKVPPGVFGARYLLSCVVNGGADGRNQPLENNLDEYVSKEIVIMLMGMDTEASFTMHPEN